MKDRHIKIRSDLSHSCCFLPLHFPFPNFIFSFSPSICTSPHKPARVAWPSLLIRVL